MHGRGRGVRLLLRNDNLFSLSLPLSKSMNKIKEECANKKEKHVKYKMLTHTIAEVTHTHTHLKCVQMKEVRCRSRSCDVVMEAENSNIKNLQFKGDLLRLVKQTQ